MPFLVFDRDDTLIDAHQQPIQYGFLCLLFKYLEQHKLPWAIATLGGNEIFAEDPYLAPLLRGLNIQSEPFYYNVPRSIAINKHITATTITPSQIREEFDKASPIDKAQVLYLALYNKSGDLGEEANATVATFCEEINFVGNDNQTVVKFTPGPADTFTLVYGKTTITLSMQHFVNMFPISAGDYKFFAVLKLLDAARLTLQMTDELKVKLASVGIIAIQAPSEYQPIPAAEVVLIDDKPTNCALMKMAGLNAIEADTHCRSANRDRTEHAVINTYIPKLFDYLINTATPSEQARLSALKHYYQLINEPGAEKNPQAMLAKFYFERINPAMCDLRTEVNALPETACLPNAQFSFQALNDAIGRSLNNFAAEVVKTNKSLETQGLSFYIFHMAFYFLQADQASKVSLRNTIKSFKKATQFMPEDHLVRLMAELETLPATQAKVRQYQAAVVDSHSVKKLIEPQVSYYVKAHGLLFSRESSAAASLLEQHNSFQATIAKTVYKSK